MRTDGDRDRGVRLERLNRPESEPCAFERAPGLVLDGLIAFDLSGAGKTDLARLAVG